MKTSVFLLQAQVVLTQTLPTAVSYKSDTCWFHGSQQLLHTTYTPPPPVPPFHKQRTSPTPAHNDHQTPAPTAPASIPHLADFGDYTNSFLSKSMGHSTKKRPGFFFFFPEIFFVFLISSWYVISDSASASPAGSAISRPRYIQCQIIWWQRASVFEPHSHLHVFMGCRLTSFVNSNTKGHNV